MPPDFVNVPKIKGNHAAMKSGMIAAETIFRRLSGDAGAEVRAALEQSWVWRSCAACATSGRASAGASGAASPLRRSTPTCCAQFALDVSPPRRPPAADQSRRSATDRISEARRQNHLRRAFFGMHPNADHEEDQPRLRLRDPEKAITSIIGSPIRPNSAIVRPASMRSSKRPVRTRPIYR